MFATDFSSCLETTLTYGAVLARHYDAALYTVNVVPKEITDHVQPPDPFYIRHSAEKKMANLAGLELLQGIKHREFVKEGFVPEVLSELIDRLEIDLVVLGTHGRGGIKKLVLGSVAEEIVDSAPCPVLTVGPHVPPKSVPELKLRKILCATDLLHGSTRALAFALWLAEQEHARVILLHVLKMPADIRGENSQSQKEMARQHLMHLLAPETAASLEAEFIVEIGSLGEHILKVAEGQNADLIVMRPHRTSYARVSRHLPWIVPHQVLCHARCPVLTVRD
ncbi:MAG TPA: universal stress protein [Terriglobales bacterium]|nr:universal stress protein [Terriglobales bacterium]